MKERPILFSTPMVKAILEGRKTVTRRIVKPCKNHAHSLCRRSGRHHISIDIEDDGIYWRPYSGSGKQIVPGDILHRYCPYGEVGDRLWVRETWCLLVDENGYTHFDKYRYYADGPVTFYDADGFETNKSGWKPSIHMPRAACRLVLEITDVRAERLQDITEEQAVNEGVEVVAGKLEDLPVFKDYKTGIIEAGYVYPRNSFRSLWEKINGPESWESNPWVWAVEFKVINQ